MDPMSDAEFRKFRKEYLDLKRKLRAEPHREWDRQLRALGGVDDNAVVVVTVTDHVRLRVDPTDESESKGLLVNLDEVGVLGFARGQRPQYGGAISRIWLLEARTGFFFWAGAVDQVPRHLPEYSAKPRQRTSKSSFTHPSGEELVSVWSDPVLLNRNADILGEK